MDKQSGILSSQSLRGAYVVDSQGQKLGQLEEVMIDMESGAVVYAIFSFGDLLGSGDKSIAIPWQALQITDKAKQILVNVKKDKLEAGQGAGAGEKTNESSLQWLKRVLNNR